MEVLAESWEVENERVREDDAVLQEQELELVLLDVPQNEMEPND